MPRPGLFMVAALALTTAIALIAAAGSLSGPDIPRTTPVGTDDNVAVVNRFYGGFNQAVATGELQDLLALLAPGFVDHSVPATNAGPGNQQRLIDAIGVLRQVHPDLRLTAVMISTDDDRVLVYVHTDGGTATAGATALPDADTMVADRVEVLRIATGQIAERWAIRDGAAFWQPVPPTWTAVAPVSTYLTVQAELQPPAVYAPLYATPTPAATDGADRTSKRPP